MHGMPMRARKLACWRALAQPAQRHRVLHTAVCTCVEIVHPQRCSLRLHLAADVAATLRSLYAACDEQLDAIAALADAGTTADEPARRPGTSIRLDESMTWTSQHADQRLTFNLNLNHVHNL